MKARARRSLEMQRVLALPAPTSAPPGRLEHVAWTLLHRASAFDPAVQERLAREWGLEGPRPSLHARAWPPEQLAAPVVNGRVAGARFRLARLAAACPPPPALLDAVRLLGAEAPWLSLKGAHQALHLADLSHGGAGVDCVVALAELWGLQADGHGLRPDPVQRGELEALAADVRAVGAAPAPCHLGWSDELHLAEAGIVVEAGNLVARQDTSSAMARALRRQLAAVGSLTPAELLAGLLRSGLLREGVLRRRVDLAGLTEMTVTAWAAQQHDIELDSSTGGDRLGLAGPSARWLRPSDPCVLALLERSDIVTRQDVVAALTAHGHRTGSASVWLVLCPWLRPAGSRGQHRRAGSM